MPIYVANFATIDDFENERDGDGFKIQDLATPQFTGTFAKREKALEVSKEEALAYLKAPYEHEIDGDADFMARIDLGYWVDGQWTVPEHGRPHSVHLYRNDGDLLAVVIVQETEIEE